MLMNSTMLCRPVRPLPLFLLTKRVQTETPDSHYASKHGKTIKSLPTCTNQYKQKRIPIPVYQPFKKLNGRTPVTMIRCLLDGWQLQTHRLETLVGSTIIDQTTTTTTTSVSSEKTCTPKYGRFKRTLIHFCY